MINKLIRHFSFASAIALAAASLVLAVVSWGDTVGMFELYTDVGNLVAWMQVTTANLAIFLLFVFGLLFGALFLIVRRADGLIEDRFTDLRATEKSVERQMLAQVHRETAPGDNESEQALWEKALGESQELLDCVTRSQSQSIGDDPRALFDTLLLDILRFTGSEYAFIGEAVRDREGTPCLQVLAVLDIAGNDETRRLEEHIPHGTRFQAFADLDEGPIIVNDLATDSHVEGVPEGHPPLHTYLGIPLRRSRRTVGVIGLANRVDGYDMELVERMEPVLSTLAGLVEAHRAWEDRERTGETLRETKISKDIILKSARDGIITMDDGGKVVEFNPAAEAMFGIRAEDALGTEIANFVVLPGLGDTPADQLQRYLDTEESRKGAQRVELSATRPDGREFPVELTVTPFELGRRRFFTVFLRSPQESKVVVEPTQRDQDDMKIIASLLRLFFAPQPLGEILNRALSLLLSRRCLGSDAKGAIFLVDDEVGELECKAHVGFNPFLLRDSTELCGRAATSGEAIFIEASDAPEEMRSLGAVLHGHYCVPFRVRGKVIGVLDLCIPTGYRRTDEEEWFTTTVTDILAGVIHAKRAEEIHQITRTQAKLFEAQREELEQAVAVSKQAEERARAAKEWAERTVRTRSEFLSRVSHSLRTPLNAIIGFSDTILCGVHGDIGNPKYKDYIQGIYDSGLELLDLIGEFFLHLSKEAAVKMETDSEDLVALANYAGFSKHSHSDQVLAEALFQRAITASPKNPVVLRNYALFRTSVRNDNTKAEALYKEALEVEPDNAVTLGNYAVFLSDIRKDYDSANAIYKRAITADPEYAPNLCNYAGLLTRIRGDHDRAETLYRRAVKADPRNAVILDNYALFLRTIREDADQAGAFHKYAVEANPDDPLPLRGYATFLLSNGDFEKGSKLMDEALSKLQGQELLQGLFYQFAYAQSDTGRSETMERIRRLLEIKIRVPLFDPSWDVRRIIEDGHPEPELLETLSQVLSVRSDVGAMNRFPVWKALDKARPEKQASEPFLLKDATYRLADDG